MRLNEYASTRRTRGSYKIPTSVQKSIPIDEIYADGTWRSGEVYSQMWSVSDINYCLTNDTACAVLSNSEFVVMLRQTKDILPLRKLYGLSEPQQE